MPTYFISMEIKTWAQLSESEKNNIQVILSSIFIVEGTSESVSEYWYNSGYIRLIREDGYKRVVGPLDVDDKDSEIIELAIIRELIPVE